MYSPAALATLSILSLPLLVSSAPAPAPQTIAARGIPSQYKVLKMVTSTEQASYTYAKTEVTVSGVDEDAHPVNCTAHYTKNTDAGVGNAGPGSKAQTDYKPIQIPCDNPDVLVSTFAATKVWELRVQLK
ncbi:MAG: hypothetical protein Q9208_002583 [Pyrenodesmia sp. 3 TL-2023]